MDKPPQKEKLHDRFKKYYDETIGKMAPQYLSLPLKAGQEVPEFTAKYPIILPILLF